MPNKKELNQKVKTMLLTLLLLPLLMMLMCLAQNFSTKKVKSITRSDRKSKYSYLKESYLQYDYVLSPC